MTPLARVFLAGVLACVAAIGARAADPIAIVLAIKKPAAYRIVAAWRATAAQPASSVSISF